MNVFLLPASERLAEWRKFRKSLESMDETSQLQAIAKWSAQIPTSNYVIDPDKPEEWPGPWELINDGDFCTTAVAYLMEQTLIMLGWDVDRLKLTFVRDMKRHDQMMVLLVDDKWALNYEYGTVFNFDTVRSDCAYLVTYRPGREGGHIEV